MVWALMLALLLCTPAFAADGIEPVIEQVELPADVNSVQEELPDPVKVDDTGEQPEKNTTVVDTYVQEVQEEETKNATPVETTEEKVKEENKDDESEKATVEESEPESRELGARSSISLSAFSSVSPTSQYANYATGLLKEVRQDEHYCFLQDSQASYAFVVGTASDMGTFTDARWWRWYNTQGVGWRVERGSGIAVVSQTAYVMLSDLQGYPSLPNEVHEVQRREVMLYALVAVSVFSLASVWAFLLRLHRSGTV